MQKSFEKRAIINRGCLKNVQAKSLKSFVKKYNTKINIRTSMTDYKKEEWLTNIPLYSIGNIEKIFK